MTETPDLQRAAHIGAELRTIAERLAAVTAEFAAFSTSLAPAPPAAAGAPMPPPQAQPYPTLPAGYGPAAPGYRVAPPPPYPMAPQPVPHSPLPQPPLPQPPLPRPPSTPLSERLAQAAERGVIGKVLAAIGVGITLIGVVLLLVLAAQAGLLRPEIRLAGGILLAATLVGTGAFIGRRADKRSGAVALVATGIATGLFVVLAAAAIYDWLPTIPALVVGGLVTGGGLWFAHRWNSLALGLMVSIPVLVFAPIVTNGVNEILIAFLLVYAAATLWLQVGRDWSSLYAVNTAATTIPVVAAATTLVSLPTWFVALALVLNVGVAVGSALLLLPGSSTKDWLGLVSTASALPLLAAPLALTAPLEWIVPAVGAAVLAAAALVTTGRASIGYGPRATWIAAAAILSAFTALVAVDIAFAVPTALVAAIVIGTAALAAGDLRRVLLTVASLCALGGLQALLADHGLEQLVAPSDLGTAVRVSILLGVIAGIIATTVLTWAWAREFPRRDDWLWITGSLVNLWLVTQLCVAVAALVTDGSVHGFRTGHTVATLIWFACAAAALLWSRRLDGPTRSVSLAAGLALITGAVAKLFLFDLAALDGVFRVIAFLVAGILLLGLGVAYAQRLTTRAPAGPDEEPATAAPLGSGPIG